ncbi:MAG: iron-sulfur cluster repair protein YtfE [Deltaproteobacteria bacterium]|nr:iron-sulfur cluster repair protein YtfE [Deltaproteobacteria bacterium]MBN2671273.1 iron-sulfur cluster repair protein YtfE [Deltaproteobacteria bacterium]
MHINQNESLGKMVTEIPDAARIFHEYGLDFCCGGKQTLAAACEAKHTDIEQIKSALSSLNNGSDAHIRWDKRPLDQLIQHILDTYHASLRADLPWLIELAERVEDVHRDAPDRPTGLVNLLKDIHLAVESHLGKEEQILFPLILSGHGERAHMPIQVMLQEHEDHGQNLQRIRTLTSDLASPPNACNTWKELYRALGKLEVELMAHIHLENNVLFPRALAGEDAHSSATENTTGEE